jgi:type IVB pilus formation R64 PilN family outer membrane protein
MKNLPKHTRLTGSLLLATATLFGCAVNKEKVMASYQEASQVVLAEQAKTVASIKENERISLEAQEVNRPFISSKMRPVSREITLPSVLVKNLPIEAAFSASPVPLSTAAQQLAKASGMTVSVTPDALMPPSAFGSRLGGTNLGAPPSAAALTTGGGAATVDLSAIAKGTPIFKVLDEVARQAQVSWRSTDTGVEIYRVETKVYAISAVPQTASTTSSLGRNAQNNAVFDAQSKTTFVLKDQNQLDGLRTTVEALLTISGRATLSMENQSLVVVDTPAAHERVTSVVEDLNKSFARRVRILIEEVEIISKNNQEAGIDWNVAWRSIGRVTAIGITSPSSITSAVAGQVNVGVTSGAYANSSAMINALSEVGHIVNRRSYPFLTGSGRPVTRALRRTFNYVDQVQAPAVGSTTTGSIAPTVTQKEETVGTFITLIPTAKPNGQIFLSINFDVTTADPLTPFTVGSSATSITVQQKSINGSGLVEEIPIRSGQTLMITGIDTLDGSAIDRRLTPDSPLILGGSSTAMTKRINTVLLVTAVIEEGI